MRQFRNGFRILIVFSILAGALLPGVSSGRALPEAGTTERISLSSAEAEGNGASSDTFISTGGQFVVFTSNASNLVDGDTNGVSDVFVRDLQTGDTSLASLADGEDLANGSSWSGSVSADGRYVAFQSSATNLVANDTNAAADVFVRDRQLDTTVRVSVDSNEAQANAGSLMPVISADGSTVAFASWASNLVGGDTNNVSDVFVRELAGGVTVRVSLSSGGQEGDDDSLDPSISADGRYVAFESYAANLVVNDTEGFGDAFVHDRDTSTTVRVSVAFGGGGSHANALDPYISQDGRFVSFDSWASDLVQGDTNGYSDVFLVDLLSSETSLVSVASGGAQGNGSSYYSAISDDGRYVAFASEASNFDAADNNAVNDIFVRDRVAGTTELISVSTGGLIGNQSSGSSLTISSDGRYVAFGSYATNLVENDANGVQDIFLHDRGAGPLLDVDLDVMDSAVIQAASTYQLKRDQPFTTVLEVPVSNHGPGTASQVSVEFYDGHPDSGTLLGSTVVASIPSGAAVGARAAWTVTASPAEADIYVKVSSADNDTDLANNITAQGTPAFIAFADYAYDPDTFSFPNFEFARSDFDQEIKTYFNNIEWAYLVSAYLYRMSNRTMHCFGMSQASIIYKETPSAKPVDKATFAMLQSEVAGDLHGQQVRQFLYNAWVTSVGAFFHERVSPINAYEEVKERLLLEDPKLAVLSVFFGWVMNDAHAVVAYKAVEIGDGKSLFIYDNEIPMSIFPIDEPVEIIHLDTVSDRFYGHLNTYYAAASDPIYSPAEITLEMIEQIIAWVRLQFAHSGKLQGFFTWGEGGLDAAPAHFLIRDAEGHRLGYDQGTFVSEIPGAEFETWDSAFYWLLPAQGEYTLETEGTGASDAALSFAIPLNRTRLQETVFTPFDLPSGVLATTDFGPSTTDWRIHIAGQPDVLPAVDQQIELDVWLDLPLVVK